MNFIRRLYAEIFIFQATDLKFSDFSRTEVGNKCKISAQYLQNYTSWAKKHRNRSVNTVYHNLNCHTSDTDSDRVNPLDQQCRVFGFSFVTIHGHIFLPFNSVIHFSSALSRPLTSAAVLTNNTNAG